MHAHSVDGKSYWLVTGGLGFIGSHFIRLVLRERPDVRIVNFDAMTYAGNPANLADIENDLRYEFVHGDITSESDVRSVFERPIDVVVNFAAESHVDRSILEPDAFLKTDVLGVHTLLKSARRRGVRRFLQISTDEVYGDVSNGSSLESDAVRPRSPYSASKAGADLQVLAYGTTFDVPVLITRGSNTYGPNQFPEKLIPLFITNLLNEDRVPIYGDGNQSRDWLFVEDHASGILAVLERGAVGNIYNVGDVGSYTNLEVTRKLLALAGKDFASYVEHVVDRPGHDRRYHVDATKLRMLGWIPEVSFADGLSQTFDWYARHRGWWEPLRGPAFRSYYATQYSRKVK